MHDFNLKLYGLCFQCPLEQEVSDCPIKNLRDLDSIEQKIMVIDSLTSTEQMNLFNKHRKCLVSREWPSNKLQKELCYKTANIPT